MERNFSKKDISSGQFSRFEQKVFGWWYQNRFLHIHGTILIGRNAFQKKIVSSIFSDFEQKTLIGAIETSVYVSRGSLW